MSLIPCTECGNQISDTAKACPHCGAKPRTAKSKAWKYVGIGLPLLLVAVVASSYVRNKAIGPEGWAMDNTVERLRAQLGDASSFKIRSSQAFVEADSGSQNKRIYICGAVEGRDTFGAHTSPIRFVSYSLSTPDTFDTVSVTVEDIAETTQARRVGMRSGFEKVYWDPHCPASS